MNKKLLAKTNLNFKRFAALSVFWLLCAMLLSTTAQASPSPSDSMFFPQTGHTVSGDFLHYWQNNGGLAAFGYPITDPAYERDDQTGQSYLTQWFERSRFELHPDSNGTNQVQLGLLGDELRGEALKADPDFLPAQPLVDPDFPNTQQFFQQTGHNLRNYFLKYWNEHDGINRYGYPISEEHLEFDPETGKFFLTQWFQRARMEYHPDQAPPNDVLLGLLGKQIKLQNQQYDRFNLAWTLGRSSSFLSYPTSVYVDSKGNIYVNDRGSGRINKYNAQHKLINYWYLEGSTQAIAGPAPTPNSSPVTDSKSPLLFEIAQNRTDVRELMPDGNWQSLNLQNSGDQDATSPNQSLAVDGDSIYILKYAANVKFLVWKYKTDGTFEGKFVERSQVNDPTAITVQNGKIYLADGPDGKYKVFDSSGNVSTNNGQSSQSNSQDFSLPTNVGNGKTVSALAIAADNNSNTWVAQMGSISRFDSFGKLAASFGTSGRNIGQMLNPVAMALDAKDNLYVADPANHRIDIFDVAGNYQDKIEDVPTNTQGYLDAARSVTVTPGPNSLILVADPVNNRIQEFSLTGQFQKQWPAPKIIQLAAAPDGSVYGLDSTDGQVVQYSLSGNELNRWGGTGSNDQKFNRPQGIAVGPDASVYVADTGNQRIQKFDAKGKFIAKWGSKGSGNGQFGGDSVSDVYAGPTSITVEPKTGNIYVVDPAQFRIEKFQPNGTFLNAISQIGPSQPFEPLAIAAAPLSNQSSDNTSGSIYVSSRNGIYELNLQDQVTAEAVATTVVSGGGDTGNGGVNNLISLAVTENGMLFATDSYSRLQKFQVR